MNCAEIKELFPLYHSGELRGPEAVNFATHLRDCPACAWDAQQEAQLDEALREAVQAEAIDTTGVRQNVLAAIRSASVTPISAEGLQRRGSGIRRLLATGALAAAILVLAVLGNQSIGAQKAVRVYRVLALDHEREVVENHWRPWLVEASDIKQLANAQGVPESALRGLTAEGYHLARGKLCILDGKSYVHLVYTDGSKEFSAYFRGAPMTAAPSAGRPRLVMAVGAEHLASYSSKHCQAFFVTNDSPQAALQIADAAARGL